MKKIAVKANAVTQLLNPAHDGMLLGRNPSLCVFKHLQCGSIYSHPLSVSSKKSVPGGACGGGLGGTMDGQIAEASRGSRRGEGRQWTRQILTKLFSERDM